MLEKMSAAFMITLKNGVFCLCLLMSFFSYSSELIVVTEVLAPYQFINKAGVLDGFSIEVIKELFKLTRDNPKINVMPWARSYSMAKNQKNVLIFSIAHTKERSKHFKWVGDLLDEEYYFWGFRSKFQKKITSEEQLKQFRIVTLRDSNEHEYLLKAGFPNVQLIVTDNQRLLMLSHDRVDLLLGTALTIKNSAKIHKIEFSILKKIFPITGLNSQLCLAFNINSDEDLVEKYKLAFKTLKNSGKLSLIRKKWDIPEK